MNKLFTPGPIPMDAETLEIGGRQNQYFRTPAFSKQMLECTDMLHKILDASCDDPVIFLTASGTAAMEAAVANIFNVNDKILVIDGGSFGKRFALICEVYGIPCEVILLKWNEAFTEEKLSPYENAGFTGLLVNVCETSTGQLYPMDIISDFCKRNNICLITDAISSFLSDAFSMKAFNCGAVIISSQKGLALPPGMSFVIVEKNVFEKRVKNNNFKSMYFNFNNYYPEILRGQTPYTPAVGIANQLHDKLKRILSYTPENYILKNKNNAEYFRKELLCKTKFTYPSYPLSSCVTPVFCKNNNAKTISDTLRDKFGVYVAPCGGELAPVIFRIAHMSPVIETADMDYIINILTKFE